MKKLFEVFNPGDTDEVDGLPLAGEVEGLVSAAAFRGVFIPSSWSLLLSFLWGTFDLCSTELRDVLGAPPLPTPSLASIPCFPPPLPGPWEGCWSSTIIMSVTGLTKLLLPISWKFEVCDLTVLGGNFCSLLNLRDNLLLECLLSWFCGLGGICLSLIISRSSPSLESSVEQLGALLLFTKVPTFLPWPCACRFLSWCTCWDFSIQLLLTEVCFKAVLAVAVSSSLEDSLSTILFLLALFPLEASLDFLVFPWFWRT